ncbi:hypothetical protein Sa4125_29760 [Aureimonas sp. SA4125]|uniref:hypothetical protein n=1 Tax=Aureimonas sp. SA4125 TaxID=2826993 RepID=UPI001CC569BD|nr:hypothetical protein [Aureimonas sp. SA4125]BDA85434.1 hypothetical protein Sa4125_29760 [Aureimonas sp. SA4125]
MRTVDQTIRRIEAGEDVSPADVRLAVAVLHQAYLELAHGVEKAVAEVGTDEWAMARLGGYAYESDIMLKDPVGMYRPAGGMLDAFLAREKYSEGTA